MEIITKCFKGGELPLAIEIVGSSKIFAEALGTYFYSFISENEMPVLLLFGTIFCLLGDFALNFMTRIYYMAVKEEDERSILEQDAKLNNPTIFVFLISILCFIGADLSKAFDMRQIIDPPPNKEGILSHLVRVLVPMVLLPLLAFRKEGRTIGVFSSFLMLSIGDMAWFLFVRSPSISLIPLKAGLCFIKASSWAIMGLWTPRKNLEVFLGGGFTLICFLACFCDHLRQREKMNLSLKFGSVLALIIGGFVWSWRAGLKENHREAARRIKL